jgi:flagellar biosynthesis protein FlhA
MTDKGLPQILVTSSDLRLAFKRFMEPSFPKLAVLAFHELPNETQVNNFASIALQENSLPEELDQAPSNTPETAVPVAA